MSSAALDADRRAELVSALGGLRARVVDAATDVGRDPRSITLIAVTKTFPASDVAILAELGVTDVAENRDQEARAKAVEVTSLTAAAGLAPPRWHFVGQLQTNKVRSVARYAHAVHSVDRPQLVTALSRAVVATRADQPLEVFIQVNLDPASDGSSAAGQPGRGGAAAEDVVRLAEHVVAADGLVLRGVMAVAPPREDAGAAFARLAEVSRSVAAVVPQATAISAGMSGDFEQAIRHGATHLRIGSALLGHRSARVG